MGKTKLAQSPSSESSDSSSPSSGDETLNPIKQKLEALKKKRPAQQIPAAVASDDAPSAEPAPKKPKSSSSGAAAAAAPTTMTTASSSSKRPRTRSMDASVPKTKPLSDFAMNEKTVKILTARGITSLFEIQCQTYQPILDGKDVVGRARTGQGKTLAYCLPVIELLFRRQHDCGKRGRPAAVLIMAPTRELAMQVSAELAATAPHLKVCSVYGGSSYEPQLRAMREGVDAVVGTPGRICDLVDKGALKLHEVQFLILDEADQMLDMGFQDEMQKVFDAVKGQKQLQTLLFSATLPKWVQGIAQKRMRAPVTTIDLIGEGDVHASTDVDHMSLMAPVNTESRAKLINDLLIVYGNLAGDGRAIIFCPTKKQCDELASSASLHVEIKAMHGDVQQMARERTLAAFRRGQVKVLVATDVAARGLDIKGVDLVINNGPPAGNLSRRADPESYVHRSGRTGRAGRKGRCITVFGPFDEHMIKDIERSTGNTLRRIPAPQPRDLMLGAAKAACEAVEAVEPKVFKHFEAEAKTLAEQMGPHEALCACLARLTGFDSAQSVRPRSLLQAAEGWVTVRFVPNSGKELHSKGLVFNAIRQAVPQAADSIRGMVLTEQADAAYFDLDCKYEQDLRELVEEDDRAEFSFPTELPKLKMADGVAPMSRGGFGGRGGSFGARGAPRGRGGRGGGGRW